MRRLKRTHALLGTALTAVLCGCVALPPNTKPAPHDPWESWNRGVYKVNDKLDRAVAKPLARTYVRAVPQPARTGVSNFLSNLHTTTVLVNDALQGKLKAAGNDFARLIVNTTIGFGGLLDPATRMGLDKNDEDFGQTLGHWGVPPGPFLELPFLGPSDTRDGPARIVDIFTGPTHYIDNNWVAYGIYGVGLIDARADLLSLDAALQRVFDPYAFIRDAYLQRRAYLVSDGKVTDEELVDPGADDDTQAPAPTKSPPPAPPPAAPPPAKPAPSPPPD
ncbi:MAG TPA: VacJ family lipoprotein [Steroidobacteraceae bacterium]|jgi:phospholipid-binding lipoprotein MlaA|nr:VacJ family lipoprotein [Steroidobacteraceae bacterium]